MATKHPFRLLKLEVEIDSRMVSVVKWLNGIKGVRTIYCCQGEPKPRGVIGKPYLLFYCSRESGLRKILSQIEAYNRPDGYTQPNCFMIDVVVNTLFSVIRYRIEWPCREALSKFCKQLTSRRRQK